jgi:hypothetical protein
MTTTLNGFTRTEWLQQLRIDWSEAGETVTGQTARFGVAECDRETYLQLLRDFWAGTGYTHTIAPLVERGYGSPYRFGRKLRELAGHAPTDADLPEIMEYPFADGPVRFSYSNQNGKIAVYLV